MTQDFLPNEFIKETLRINESILKNLKKNLTKIESEIEKVIKTREDFHLNIFRPFKSQLKNTQPNFVSKKQ